MSGANYRDGDKRNKASLQSWRPGGAKYQTVPLPKRPGEDITAAILESWNSGMPAPQRSLSERQGNSPGNSSGQHTALSADYRSTPFVVKPPVGAVPSRYAPEPVAQHPYPEPDRSYDVAPQNVHDQLSAPQPLTDEEIDGLALFDPQTSAFNLRYMIRRMEYELMRAQYFSRPISVLVVSIDNFDSIAAQGGGVLLNKLLDATASTLFSKCQPVNLVGRYTEGRFLVVCPELADAQASRLSEEIRQQAQCILIKHQSLVHRLSLSIGVAVYAPGFEDLESLVGLADLGADLATERGGNAFCVAANEVK